MNSVDYRQKVAALAEPFPSRYVHQNPSGGGRYVTHSVITQRLIAVLGEPPDFHLVQVIRGHVPAILADPGARSQRAKEGRPALDDAVVGVVCKMVAKLDRNWGTFFEVEEAGDCEDPHNWPHDGARIKDAMSDAYKRCAMRIGCGLHLWLKDQDEYFLHSQLLAALSSGADVGADGRSGSVAGIQVVRGETVGAPSASTTSSGVETSSLPPSGMAPPDDVPGSVEAPAAAEPIVGTADPGEPSEDGYPTPCPECGSQARQKYTVKPDIAWPGPHKERHHCYDCGYDSGWRPLSPGGPETPNPEPEKITSADIREAYGGATPAAKATHAMFPNKSVHDLSQKQRAQLIAAAPTPSAQEALV